MTAKKHTSPIGLRTIIFTITLLSIILFVMMFAHSIMLTRTYTQISSNDALLLKCTTSVQELDRAAMLMTQRAYQYIQHQTREDMERFSKEMSYNLRPKIETLQAQSRSQESTDALADAVEQLNFMLERDAYAMRLVATACGERVDQLPRAVFAVSLTDEDAALSPEEMVEKARELVAQADFPQAYNAFCKGLDEYQRLVVADLEQVTEEKEDSAQRHLGHQFASMLSLVLLYILTSAAATHGILRPLESHINSIRKGEPFQVEGVHELRDMARSYNEAYSHNIENQEKLRRRAEHDPMTGLLNQGNFGVLKQRLQHCREKLGLLVIDVDYFKHINDVFGHEVGNLALKKIASTLASHVRPGDYVIRYGGDEFVVVMLNMAQEQASELEEMFTTINSFLQQPDDGLPPVSLSVGASFSETGFHDTLFQQADQAMYDVKRKGRCGFAVYQEPDPQAGDNDQQSEQGKPRILLVDDSEMNREILCSMLEDQYDVFQVSNGMQAIEEIGKKGYTLSAILLDLMMPVCDGYEVLAYMQKHRWHEILPVIIISSETDPSCINRAYDLGATDFISRPFDGQIVRRRVSNTVGLNLRYKRLSDLVTRKIQEKIDGYDMMLSVLSQVVEFRNHESGDHVLHIGLITDLLLDCLMKKSTPYNLTHEDMQQIRFASALHDIGKITIPDEIINKPGKLTDEERAIMETHSAAGADMLDQVEGFSGNALIRRAREICRWHHERYDGRGYPDGLVGDAIPISAQVVAVADVYDALTSKRCYKASFPHEQAISMILEGKCGAFNPLLMECLTEIADQLPEKLHSDAKSRKWDADANRMVNEMSHLGEMDMATKMLYQLRFEHSSAEYFQQVVNGCTFSYRVDTEMLLLSSPLAALLGTEEFVHLPTQDEQLLAHAGKSDISWRDLRNGASTTHPDCSFHITHGEGEDTRVYTCHMRTIWSVEDTPQYLGVVGILLPA
ncbi:MAG: diguanylate cyclase [Clostridiales bacterium]|nr:diguanylate cyclase [Clostridiales bacterium]